MILISAGRNLKGNLNKPAAKVQIRFSSRHGAAAQRLPLRRCAAA